MAVKVRKTFVSSMYDKVGSLSMKSLTETNSGKLITMISADIQSMERGLTYGPMMFTAPFNAFLILFLIKVVSGSWESFFIVGGWWILCIFLTVITSASSKKALALSSFLSDGRMKLINDMVSGARTIKSYAWENHFFKKISELRRK